MPRKRHEQSWRQWARDLQRRQRTIETEWPQVVMLARRNGETWAAIAEVLGISEQAVHKRYAAMDRDRVAAENKGRNRGRA